MTSPIGVTIRSSIVSRVIWKTIAAAPALIACAAVLRTMRTNDLRVAMSMTSLAVAAMSASSPGGRTMIPARTATSDAESSMFGAMRIGRSDSSTASVQM